MRFLKFLTFALGALGLVVLTGRAPVAPPRPPRHCGSNRRSRRESVGPGRVSCMLARLTNALRARRSYVNKRSC